MRKKYSDIVNEIIPDKAAKSTWDEEYESPVSPIDIEEKFTQFINYAKRKGYEIVGGGAINRFDAMKVFVKKDGNEIETTIEPGGWSVKNNETGKSIDGDGVPNLSELVQALDSV
ncbi:hypothetical protein KKH23_07720 [Patescibacteria group bacterium]|nr:hypothetical protein [Patescibacteria group bacterium]